ncbi:T9SS type B sorting domain-containing protein [Sabulilitoribacter multivorans]|uniref:T9SS type B sorting domain-containing protein n=1 Tax=Flaviramulus multivorans TaxID=1304750 RepID=A0ABS9IHC0_9FLAO|nr:T9SS type B sorting domain-containing protein [Flaviramulus multivorans]MCF7559555.1 T9SS type B sorting domain-containing protein [Flaviramulus multivorans]
MVNKVYIGFVITFCLISFKGISQTFVPDDNFEQALIDLGYDSGPLDDFVPTANISSVTTLSITDKSILDLTGIEDFTALSILDCSGNQLSSINVSQNTNLTELYCFGNQLTNLNVTSLSALKILWCYQNRLTNLNVSQNTELISLLCGINQIQNLDVSNNTKLVVLSFQRNEISDIDVTNLTNLMRLQGGNNLLKTLDVSKNTKLSTLTIQNNEISAIDISNLTELDRLQCGRNLLTALDISKNLKLTYVSCEINQIIELDPSKNLNLITLICYFNLISELDVTKNTALVVLDCSNNLLCSLNIKNGNNKFTVVDFRLNYFLSCVVVDSPSDIPINWEPEDYQGYVSSVDECPDATLVDALSDVVANNSFTLPILTNGSYFTASGGNGTMLNSGDTITSSQTIYIYNESSCGINESSFNVLILNGEDYYVPKYFTPNNDGSHDFWQVVDSNNTINNITIYDQYGKLLKFLLPNSIGWDGTYNGAHLQSNDYWYVLVLNTGESVTGHFTLKR